MESEKERLQQLSTIKYFKQKFNISDMLSICFSKSDDKYNHGIYPMLIPNDIVDKIMSSTTWNFNYNDGYPYFYEDNGEIEYFR